MKKKTIQNRAPIKRPAGKQYPLAGKAFAEEAKRKEQGVKATKREMEQKLSNLNNTVIDAKKTSNQSHFTLASSFLAGTVSANFVALRGDGLEENIARVAMIVGVAGLIKSVNNHYAIRGAIYKSMLDKIKNMTEASEEKDLTVKDIPLYKALYDEAKKETATTKQQKKAIRKQFNNRKANLAVNIIAGAALSVFAAKAGNIAIENQDFIKATFRDWGQKETPAVQETLSMPTKTPH